MTRQQAQYAQRKADGRCVKCGEKQAHDRIGKSTCRDCQRANNVVRAAHYQPRTCPERVANRSTQIKRDMEFILAHPELDAVAQSNQLGVSLQRIYAVRARARKLGHNVPWVRSGYGGRGVSPKWAALDFAARCSTCGLLLPHDNCLEDNTNRLASMRSGPGRVMP